MPPPEAESGTLDECPTQDNDLGAHRPQDPDAARALAAEPAHAAPPIQVAGSSESVNGSELRIKDDLEGNGPVAPTRSANASSEADSKPLSGDGEQAARDSFKSNELNEAAEDFFFSTAGGPVASGEGTGAIRCTFGLLITVHGNRKYLWEHRRADLKALFAPALLSKQEVFAYLMNDALDRPLLHKADALRFGQRCDNGLAKAERVKATARACCYQLVRAARKAAAVNPELAPGIADAEAAGAAALAAALDDVHDIKPPGTTVGAKRKAPEPLTPEQEWEQVKARRDELDEIMYAAERGLDELTALHGKELPVRDLSNPRERRLAESEALCHAKVEAAGAALDAALDAAVAYDQVYTALRDARIDEQLAESKKVADAAGRVTLRELLESVERDGTPPPSPKPRPSASECILQTNTCGPACLFYPDLVSAHDIWVEWDGREFTSQWMEWELAREEDGAGWREACLERTFEASYRREDRIWDRVNEFFAD